jgi:predicted enzyme related to lactoylglutathione lyase
MNLNGLLIGSENPKRLVDYYTKLFGKPNWDEGGYVGWLIGSGSVTVAPHDQVKGKNTTSGRLIWNIETADVKGQFEKFKAAGATVVKEPYQMGEAPGQEAWITTFADPDNNYFQLMSPRITNAIAHGVDELTAELRPLRNLRPPTTAERPEDRVLEALPDLRASLEAPDWSGAGSVPSEVLNVGFIGEPPPPPPPARGVEVFVIEEKERAR